MKYTYRNADLVIGISKKLSFDLSQFIGKKVQTIYSPGYDKEILNLAKKKIHFHKIYKNKKKKIDDKPKTENTEINSTNADISSDRDNK